MAWEEQDHQARGVFTRLRHMWVQLITRLKGLGSLKKLKILSIQSNRITKLEGLEVLEDLDQLYLSHNGIQKIEGLEHNVSERLFDALPYSHWTVLLDEAHDSRYPIQLHRED